MVSRWWDPGDLGVRDAFSHREGFGLEVWRFALILRWFGLKRDKGIREKLRNYGILGDLLAISILRKMVSQRREEEMVALHVLEEPGERNQDHGNKKVI
ncbi:hypothetical protein IGI04_029257 [Brassica rapa subsp. trilocularis]|uniref:Uncharacterized protein n=1 Tax=Brassica rapa subsp. trilocularis TaxID=1813537 RepID=A0ABQ7LPQ3_BRACM|nr:hypothetical protein IGI04_029257 [Brassica rapa subsp. trilocularis]